ncbi:hypothetical protein [Alcaligenes phenolicus]|uniref:hypothetical protein n=1 Tax=Alcaligenes phenolicus TaxID=232846 RepID=UPI000E832D9D|nr:hypothetical protein [Alcaligenes phenolicus]HBJ68354.1 hypothetical protein [Alcaligenes faecalis]
MAQPKQRAAPDWERIEADYRAGLLSVREIAAANGVSHVAIGKRAKRDGWERDLDAKIKAKADALVTKAEVTKEVTSEQAVTERRIVEANAQVIAEVRVSHRRDIARARSLAMKLLDELEIQTDNIDLLEQLETALAGEDGSDGLTRVFQRVTSTSGRIDSAKKLAEAMKVLVGMEREAYGIVDAAKVEHTGKDGGPVEVVHMTPEAIREVMEKDDC